MSLPPQQLVAPPVWLRTLLTPIWAALLIIAVAAQIGGTWRVYDDYLRINPAFAALGLRSGTTNGQVFVDPTPGVAQVQSIRNGSVIAAINDEVVEPGTSRAEISRRLAALGETPARLYIGGPDDSVQDQELTLQRSPEAFALARPWSLFITDRVLTPLLGGLAAAFAIWVAILLWRRREDPVAQVLTFGLLGLVLIGEMPVLLLYWLVPLEAQAGEIAMIPWLLTYACLIVAIPAFPDGGYYPRWSGWLAIAAPLWVVLCWALLHIPALEGSPIVAYVNSWQILVALVLLAVIAAILRFRATPPGREKQQMKWAVVGIVFGLLALQAANLLLTFFILEGPAQIGIEVAASLLSALGTIAIPLGILMSLLGLRLNDADGAIGRSAGYALITLLIGALWTASTTWINRLIGDQLSPAAAAGISTMIAAAIFVPTRERILKWTEKRFQPALVRMRGLPAKLLPWRNDHNPADVARGTLLAIVNGVQASSAALVLDDDGPPRVLATYEADEQIALADLELADPETRAFPVRLRLDDLVGPIGFLLIGPRSDGASYNSDEKAAMKLVAGPLAEVLRATSRRAGRNQALTEMLTAVDARVARLEALKAAA